MQTKTANPPYPDPLVETKERELDLQKIDKYKARILVTKDGPVLDIREFIENDVFNGFTPRGISLSSRHDIQTLANVIDYALGYFDKKGVSP